MAALSWYTVWSLSLCLLCPWFLWLCVKCMKLQFRLGEITEKIK